ncbi:unnamed protein product [Allacma fusca]|uniref:CRAL/TRIO N-terminal domain-containing protein n=1 Tax=Allacma fusca TaxID=39272 RepID=A0A8J2P2S3_9HEXA|nr:unnamed protein product [Allacma fusca]
MTAVFSPVELAALEKFRLRIGDIVDQLDEFDAHDRNLIRWLRARDMSVDKAEKMIRENMKVRKEFLVDELQYRDFPEVMLQQLPFTPCGHDKQGIVVCIIPFGIWNLKALVQNGHDDKEILLYLAQIFERYFRYMKNNHSIENFKTEINLLIDYSQFSLPDYLSKRGC